MMILINNELLNKLDENGNPTPYALNSVADVFEELHQKGVDIDMTSFDWHAHNPCLTPCCHAGAFAVAAGLHKRGMHLAGTPEEDILGNYHDAASKLARYLGFNDPRDESPMIAFRRWANENPDIWGNPNGGQLFTADTAFCPDGKSVTLRIIAAHYRGMAKRLTLKAAA